MKHERELVVNRNVALPGHVSQVSLLAENERIKALLDGGIDVPVDCEVIDALGKTAMPSIIDSHNHIADPGPYNFRGDQYCGSRSTASGGITTICNMPLPLKPAIVDRPGFELKRDIVERCSVVDFALWEGLISSSIKDMKEMHGLGCIGFEGFICFVTGVYPCIAGGYLVDEMRAVAFLDDLIALHTKNVGAADFRYQYYSRIWCEDEACFDDARPWRAEYDAVQRVVLFAGMAGARLEICHTTISRGAEFLHNAKKEGTRIYIGACPHYLILDKDVLREKKSFARCTPLFRSRENVEKTQEYVMDGTINIIGSDHGPYTDKGKVRADDFWKEFCGFGCGDVMPAIMISGGANRRGPSWKKLADLTSTDAARTLGLYPRKGNLLPGADADFIFIDSSGNQVYNGSKSFSKIESVKGPYQGMELKSRVTDTYVRGKRVYGDGEILCQAGYGIFVKCEAQA